MRVEVYKSTTRTGRFRYWSIRAAEGADRGRVIARRAELMIHGPAFVVQPAGRERVRATGRKNVHAFVRGEFDEGITPTWLEGGHLIAYNARKHGTFVLVRDGRDVAEIRPHSASFHSDGALWAYDKVGG